MALGLGLGFGFSRGGGVKINDYITAGIGQSLIGRMTDDYSGAGAAAMTTEAALFFDGTVTYTDGAADNQYLTETLFVASGDGGNRDFVDDTVDPVVRGGAYGNLVTPISNKDTYKWIIMDLGQSDAGVTPFPYTLAEYQEQYQNLIDFLLADFPSLKGILLTPTGRYDGGEDRDANTNLVREAQLNIISANSKVYLGVETYDLTLVDSFHPNQPSSEELGERYARRAAKIGGQNVVGENATGPQVTTAEYAGDRISFVIAQDSGTDWTPPTSGPGMMGMYEGTTGNLADSIVRETSTSGYALLQEGKAPDGSEGVELWTSYGDGGNLDAAPDVAKDNATNSMPLRTAILDATDTDAFRAVTSATLEEYVHARGGAKTYSSGVIVDEITGLGGTIDSMVEDVAGEGPTYDGDYLEFVNTTDKLHSNQNASVSSDVQEQTWMVALKVPTALPSFGNILGMANSSGSGDKRARIGLNSSGELIFSQQLSGSNVLATGLVPGQKVFLAVNFYRDGADDGTNLYAQSFLDDGTTASGTVNTFVNYSNQPRHYLGYDNGNPADSLLGKVYTAAWYTGGNLTEAERLNIYTQVNERFFNISFATEYPNASGLYSLRNLNDASSDVVRVRRNSDDAESDFTATEVDGGTLLDYVVPTGVQALYGNAMYFDWVDDYVRLDNSVTLPISGFTLDFKVLLTQYGNQGIVGGGGTAGMWFYGSPMSGLSFHDGATQVLMTGVSLDLFTEHNLRISSDGSNLILTDLDTSATLGTVGIGALGDFSIDRVGRARNVRHLNGYIVDIDMNSEAAYQGYGNQNSNWGDQIGSNDGTVNGSPALFTGQGFEGADTVLYDQRVSTDSDAMFFDGVDDYVDLSSQITLSGEFTISGTIIYENLDTPSWVFVSDDTTNNNYIRLQGASNNQFTVNVSGTSGTIVTDASLVVNEKYDLVFTRNASNVISMTINGVPQTNTITAAGDLILQRIGARNSGLNPTRGVIYDVNINDVASYNGNGNTNEAWEDQIGSNDGTVNGSPQRANPNDITIISRDFTQDTAADQPLAVKDGALVTIGDMKGLNFNGSTQHLRCPADEFITPTTALQVAFVFKATDDTVASFENFLGQYDTGADERSWRITMSNTKNLLVSFGDPADGTFETNVTSTSALTDIDEPQVLAFTYDAGTVVMYKNGVVVASSGSSIPTSLYDSSADAIIGARNNSGSPTEFLDGSIGEIYISDNLDDDIIEIQQDMMAAAGITA